MCVDSILPDLGTWQPREKTNVIRITIGLDEQMNPVLHNHVETIKPRSRAEVIRRLAEIGLMFEKGLLITGHGTAQLNTKRSSNASGPTTDKDLFDDDILSVFNMES